MPRRSQSEIDDEIVDAAAGLFARQGFAATSVQQVADAVGYSKTGLLHRFRSKEALYAAAVAFTRERLTALVASVADLPSGPDRDRAVVTALIDLTLGWPGVAAWSLVVQSDQTPADEDLVAAGLAAAAAFDLDLEDLDHDRLVRVVSATAGLTSAALRARELGLEHEWRPLMLAAAMSTLGHAGPAG